MSLFQMSVAGGALILCIVVVRALAIHRLPKTTFLVLWMIAALRLLLPLSIPLPFNIHIGLDVFSDVVQELPSGNIASTLPGDSPPSYDIGTAVPSPATEHISTFEILWLVGVLLLAIYFSISYFRSMRKFRMSIPDNTPYIQNWLTAHQISRPLAVRSSDLISSPLTYGILHPVILLPKKLDRNDQAALKYVLTHEYVHIRRFDAITKILFAAVLCIHWFNPLVWVMYVLANRDIELSCDAWVIRMMGEKNRSSYALMLIKMEEKRSGMSALCSHLGKNAISERIEAIMKFKKTSILACAFALVLVVGATTAFATSNVTVPVLGLGIKPLGPKTRPNLPNIPIQSGVAIKVSNSNQPPEILSIISSAPASSAPASFASVAFTPLAITQTLTVLPSPAGNTVVERTC